VLRWLALSSFLYSGVQLCLTGFLVTYLVAEVELSLVLAGMALAVTHAAGAAGRLAWGWLADRLRSGTRALILNGALSIAGAIATGAIGAHWPVWAIGAAAALFGFCAMGWNGVFMAEIARQSPRESVGVATGGSLAITYAGVVAVPPAFAALHDRAGLAYGAGYVLLTLVIALGIACVVLSRRSARSAPAAQASRSALDS
jgi:fucose permease